MTTRQHYTGLTDLAEVLSDKGLEGLGNAVALLINEAMKIERESHINARDARNGYANGVKPKKLNTRLGQMDLKVPQVRGWNFILHF